MENRFQRSIIPICSTMIMKDVGNVISKEIFFSFG